MRRTIPVSKFDINPMTNSFSNTHKGMSSMIVVVDYRDVNMYIDEMNSKVNGVYFHTTAVVGSTTSEEIFMYFPYHLNGEVVKTHNSLVEKYNCVVCYLRYVFDETHMQMLISDDKFRVVTASKFKEFKYSFCTRINEDELENIRNILIDNKFIEYDHNNENDVIIHNKVFTHSNMFFKIYTVDISDIMIFKFKFGLDIKKTLYCPYIWDIPHVTIPNNEVR